MKNFNNFLKKLTPTFRLNGWILTVTVEVSLVSGGGSNSQEDILKTTYMLIAIGGLTVLRIKYTYISIKILGRSEPNVDP